MLVSCCSCTGAVVAVSSLLLAVVVVSSMLDKLLRLQRKNNCYHSISKFLFEYLRYELAFTGLRALVIPRIKTAGIFDDTEKPLLEINYLLR